MVYVAAEMIGGFDRRCIGVCKTIQEARKLSMKCIGKNRSRVTCVYRLSNEKIMYLGIAKGMIFKSNLDLAQNANYEEEMFLPKSPERYVIIKGRYPYNHYFVDSKGCVVEKATDSTGRPYFTYAKTQL